MVENLEEKAEIYFLRIAKAINAIHYRAGHSPFIVLKAAPYTFRVTLFSVHRYQDLFSPLVESTCWRYVNAQDPTNSAPYCEQVAAVALLLHDKPELFDVWRKEADRMPF